MVESKLALKEKALVTIDALSPGKCKQAMHMRRGPWHFVQSHGITQPLAARVHNKTPCDDQDLNLRHKFPANTWVPSTTPHAVCSAAAAAAAGSIPGQQGVQNKLLPLHPLLPNWRLFLSLLPCLPRAWIHAKNCSLGEKKNQLLAKDVISQDDVSRLKEYTTTTTTPPRLKGLYVCVAWMWEGAGQGRGREGARERAM